MDNLTWQSGFEFDTLEKNNFIALLSFFFLSILLQG